MSESPWVPWRTQSRKDRPGPQQEPPSGRCRRGCRYRRCPGWSPPRNTGGSLPTSRHYRECSLPNRRCSRCCTAMTPKRCSSPFHRIPCRTPSHCSLHWWDKRRYRCKRPGSDSPGFPAHAWRLRRMLPRWRVYAMHSPWVAAYWWRLRWASVWGLSNRWPHPWLCKRVGEESSRCRSNWYRCRWDISPHCHRLQVLTPGNRRQDLPGNRPGSCPDSASCISRCRSHRRQMKQAAHPRYGCRRFECRCPIPVMWVDRLPWCPVRNSYPPTIPPPAGTRWRGWSGQAAPPGLHNCDLFPSCTG